MSTRQEARELSNATAEAAGRHLLIECFGAHADCGAADLEALMRRAALAGGARVLSCHMHRFGEGEGVTGVALLAESHITVHTWPERQYAAFDVFMCGDCDADQAAATIAAGAQSHSVAIRAVDRPLQPVAATKATKEPRGK